MNNVIITQIKNQQGRILDWILYHYEQGFDTFVIYDDFSEDDTILEINSIKELFNINIIIKETDGEGKKNSLEDCKNSNSYGLDISLHNRIQRSYTSGNDYVKSINKNALCAFLDVDEFLVSSSEVKIVDIIKEEMLRLNSKQLVINSFDVSDNFEIENWYTTQDITSNRWSFDSTMKSDFKNRYKSVIICDDLEKVIQVHILKWLDDPIIENFRVYDFEKLRIHHFRKPTLKSEIIFENDHTLINKVLKIREKYDKI